MAAYERDCRNYLPNSDSGNSALLILNQPLNNLDALSKYWQKAVIRIAVDGGGNRLYNLCNQHNVLPDFIPDLLTGDFDSVTQEVLGYYKKMGVKIIPTPDQDHTDFTKALMECSKILKTGNLQVESVIVLVQTSGRVDHILSLIQTLYRAPSILDPPVILIADESVSWLLQPGKHVIKVPDNLLNSWCGLIPVGHPAERVTTSGLKWNLNNQKMEFGELISTSNSYESDTVTVETDKPLLWTMGSLPE